MDKKPIIIFPEILNRNVFVFNDHPKNLHPESIEYNTYWLEQEKRCIEGLWAEEAKNHWRFMPPQLYFYTNICKIIDEDEDSNSTEVISPYLRATEWFIGIRYLICRGFSGFENSDFTCHSIIKKLESGKKLTAKEKTRLSKLKHVKNENGEYKKYKDPVKALEDFYDKPLGKCYYENNALNLLIFGSRGLGKSFYGASCILHEWYFHGQKEFDIEGTKRPSPVELLVTSIIQDKSTDLLTKAKLTMDYIQQEVGSYRDTTGITEIFYPGYFHLESSGSLSPNSKLIQKYQKKKGNSWVTAGIGTFIDHKIATIENPAVAAGKRNNLILYEEIGLATNILDVIGTSKDSMRRSNKFGTFLGIGTSGFIDKLTGVKTIFENGSEYDFFVEEDVYEGRPKPICTFLPAYVADNDFIDDNGNINYEEAYQAILDIRAELLKSESTEALDQEKMNRPLVPSEMFIQKGGTKLPVGKLRDRKTYLDINENHKKIMSVGWFKDDEFGLPVFIPDLNNELKPIMSYDIRGFEHNLKGAVVIYEHPPDRIPKPTFKKSLYKVTYDPVKDDHGGTSLCSIIVHKGFPDTSWEEGLTDTIVAEYIGRLEKVNDMHRMAIWLTEYYNAKILPGRNISDFIRYVEMKNKFYLLQPSPWLAMGKIINNPSKKYDVGVDMSSPRLQEHCIQLLAQWYLTPRKVNDFGVTTETNIDYLYSTRLIDESIIFNGPKSGNFDHLRSAMLLALWLAQESEEPIFFEDENQLLKDWEQFLAPKRDFNYEFYHNY